MALTQRLDLRQTQSLVMTPQLQQAIKLLQLSNLELSDFVDREIEQNPLLDRDDGPEGGGSEGSSDGGAGPGRDGAGTPSFEGERGESERGEGDAEIERPPLDSHDLATSGTLAAGADQPLDTDFENVWTNGSAADEGFRGDEAFGDWSRAGGRNDFGEEGFNLEQVVAGAVPLRDHLTGQLNIDITDPVDRAIGLALIDLVDEAGYIT